MSETYTPGYCSNAVAFMSARSAEREAAFLLRRLKPGMRLLDIGCGPGTITAGLARAVAPGEVVGLDRAGGQLDLARENAARRGLANVRFVPGSVYTLPFADQEFDVVFAHALFEHLNDQVAALREIHRVLRPGGFVALRSPDWGGFIAHPTWPEFQESLALLQQIQKNNGGDVHAGRKLKEWALAAGFRSADWSAAFEFTANLVEITEFFATQLEFHTPKAAQPLDTAAVARLTTALRTFPNHPGATFAGMWGEVVAVK